MRCQIAVLAVNVNSTAISPIYSLFDRIATYMRIVVELVAHSPPFSFLFGELAHLSPSLHLASLAVIVSFTHPCIYLYILRDKCSEPF